MKAENTPLSQNFQRLVDIFCLCYPGFTLEKVVLLKIPASELSEKIEIYIRRANQEVKELRQLSYCLKAK